MCQADGPLREKGLVPPGTREISCVYVGYRARRVGNVPARYG